MKKTIIFLLMFSAITLWRCEDDDVTTSDLMGGWELVSYTTDGETHTQTSEDQTRYLYFADGYYYASGIFEISSGNYKVVDGKLKIFIEEGEWNYEEYIKIKSYSSTKMVLIIYDEVYTFKKNNSIHMPTEY